MWYIHKHEVSLQYGGPEEGGWWYEAGVPVKDFKPLHFHDEETAYETCRNLNRAEYQRRDKEEAYEFTSTLAWKSNHYSFRVEDFYAPVGYPKERPHYE